MLKDASVTEAKIAIYNAPTANNILYYHSTDGMKWGQLSNSSIDNYAISYTKLDLTGLNKYLIMSANAMSSISTIPYSDLSIASGDIAGSKITDNTISEAKLYIYNNASNG